MTNIKTWLDNNYPKDQRKNLVEIHLFGKDLEGEIELKHKDFPKLERIFYTDQVKIVTDWDINKANILKMPEPKGVKVKHYHNVEILKYISIEEILAKKYPSNSRGAINKLKLTRQGLRGKLDLSDFTNLEELEIELDRPWIPRHFESNYINGLDLSQNTKLKKVNLTNVPVELNLDIFENLIALEELNIPKGNGFGQWVGSLESLKDLPLINLNLSGNSKITNWDNLPITITDLNCKDIPFYEQTKPFAFDIKAWKMVKHSELVEKDKQKLIKKLNEKLIASLETIQQLNKKGLTEDNLLSQIEILQTKCQELIK